MGKCPSPCRHCRHLPSLLRRLAKVSGEARPDGRLPACAWRDVAPGAQLLSTPLPSGLRFFHLPMPARLSAPLAVRFPLRETYGVAMFRRSHNEWGRRALSTGSVCAHDTERESPWARSSALVAQACQHLWLVFYDDVYRACTWGRPPIPPRPVSVSVLTDTSSPHGCDASLTTVGSLSEGSVQIVTLLHIFVGYR